MRPALPCAQDRSLSQCLCQLSRHTSRLYGACGAVRGRCAPASTCHPSRCVGTALQWCLHHCSRAACKGCGGLGFTPGAACQVRFLVAHNGVLELPIFACYQGRCQERQQGQGEHENGCPSPQLKSSIHSSYCCWLQPWLAEPAANSTAGLCLLSLLLNA